MDRDAVQLAGFVKDLLALWSEDYSDIDGADFQGLLVKHELVKERPATEEDCKTEWAQEYGLEPGDTMLDYRRIGAVLRDIMT